MFFFRMCAYISFQNSFDNFELTVMQKLFMYDLEKLPWMRQYVEMKRDSFHYVSDMTLSVLHSTF